MKVEVLATHQEVSRECLEGKLVVVIDTLRATSTIVTALSNGCRQVFPVTTSNEAKVLASGWDPETVILGGEYKGHRFRGFNLGNSPRHYNKDLIAGKTLFLVTTNGTVALSKAELASVILIGSLLNGNAIAEYVTELKPDKVVIMCAGTQGRFSLEDVITAGKILCNIWDREPKAEVSELAIAGYQLYQINRRKLVQLLRQTAHGQLLCEHGDEDDLDFCLREDMFPVVPHMAASRIRLLPALNPSLLANLHGVGM